MAGPAIVSNRFYPRANITSGGPTPSGDALLAVANVAALQILDDTTIDDGGVVSMKSVLDLWILDKSSALAVDNITVVLPSSGTGRWIRLNIPNLTWQLQAIWYVNEATGNDENTGASSLAPLATWDEYQRRVGEGPLTVSHTVNLVGTITQDIDVNTIMDDGANAITLQGVRSAALYSGSVTAKQAQNAATNTDLQITDAALPVSWTASGLVDKLCVLTSGPNAGAAGWIVRDMGAKTARITKFYDDTAGTYVEPAVGETFDVVDLGLVEGALLGINGGNVRCQVRDLRFVNPGALVLSLEGGNWGFFFCDLEGGSINLSGSSQQSSFVAAVGVVSTRLQATNFILNERATANLYNAYLASGITMRTHGTITVSGDTVYQYKGIGAPFAMRANGGSRFSIRSGGTFGVFDMTVVGQRALLASINGVAMLFGYIWGYGNTFDYALEARASGAIVYDAAFTPVVATGAVRDCLIGNLGRNYGVLPVSNLSKLCGIVQS
jgi:hypothetical protein